MFPLTYGTLYKTPENYQPPEDAELSTNTEYPNLNSRDYAKRPLNHTMRMHTAWECITLNEEQQAILATNKLEGRDWTSSLWGFENVDELVPEEAKFKLQCSSLITSLQYVANNIFLMAMHSGKLQVWSTRSEVRNPKNPYCLFQIGEKCEHLKPISCMEVMKSNGNKAISASGDGTLKLWDMGSADLFSTHTFRFAHTDVITGVDSSCKDESIFATCSLDKSALLWDERLARSATALYDKHKLRFKALAWASPTQDTDENCIYLGDEAGYLHTVDKRKPNEFVHNVQVLDRPIRKIIPNANKLAIIGDTNIVKILRTESATTVAVEIYCNSESKNFVRDAVWSSPHELYTVGFEGKLRVHKLV